MPNFRPPIKSAGRRRRQRATAHSNRSLADQSGKRASEKPQSQSESGTPIVLAEPFVHHVCFSVAQSVVCCRAVFTDAWRAFSHSPIPSRSQVSRAIIYASLALDLSPATNLRYQDSVKFSPLSEIAARSGTCIQQWLQL